MKYRLTFMLGVRVRLSNRDRKEKKSKTTAVLLLSERNTIGISVLIYPNFQRRKQIFVSV